MGVVKPLTRAPKKWTRKEARPKPKGDRAVFLRRVVMLLAKAAPGPFERFGTHTYKSEGKGHQIKVLLNSIARSNRSDIEVYIATHANAPAAVHTALHEKILLILCEAAAGEEPFFREATSTRIIDPRTFESNIFRLQQSATGDWHLSSIGVFS